MLIPFWEKVQIKLKSVLQSCPTDMILLSFMRPSSALRKQIGDAWFSHMRKQQVEFPGDPITAPETKPCPLPWKPGEQTVSAPAAFLSLPSNWLWEAVPCTCCVFTICHRQSDGSEPRDQLKVIQSEKPRTVWSAREPSCFLSFNSVLPKWGILSGTRDQGTEVTNLYSSPSAGSWPLFTARTAATGSSYNSPNSLEHLSCNKN